MTTLSRTAIAASGDAPVAVAAPRRLRLQIGLAFAAIYLIWGSTFLATRYAVQTIPPFFVSGTRFFLAGLVLFIYGRWHYRETITARQWTVAAGLGALFFAVCHGGLSWAARHVPSGISALIQSSVSLWTAVIEVVANTRTRPGSRVLVSLLAGFAGIALLVLRPELLAGSHVGSLGPFVLLIGAFAWALATVLTRYAELPRAVPLSAGMQMMCGGGLLLVLGAVSGQAHGWSPAQVSPHSLAGMVFLTLIGSLVGFTCYLWLLQHCPPTQVATYAYVNPIVALTLGWLIAGEQLTPRVLLAGLIVIGAVATIITSRARRPAR